MKPTVTLAVLFLTLLSHGAPAWAQDEQLSVDQVAGAKAHLSRGETFYQLGQFEKALAEFKAAPRLLQRQGRLPRGLPEAGRHLR